ncbi:MAG: FISUMP domain-containing protein [Melioribacteraceae bacterium]|nr:MAG: FISUMP domain-containing protein [Melioribacteraceae bacterium]
MKKCIIITMVIFTSYLNVTSQTITGRLINQYTAGIPNAELKLYMYPNEYSTSSSLDGSFTFSGLTSVDEDEQLPKGYGVSNNFPNPFNPETRIIVTLPQTSKVKVDVYNIIGQVVLDKPAEILSAGTNQIDLKLNGLSNGIYLARMTIDDKYTVMRKLSLVYGSQHLSKVGPSSSSLIPKINKSSLVNIDSLVVTGANVVKTTFVNLPPYTGSNLNLGTLTVNIAMELTEETFLADSSTANKLIEHDSTTFTFSSDADQLEDLDVGKILVLGVDDGYLKKVTAIEWVDDKIIVSTENAKLDEVIETGSINFEGSFDVSNALITIGSGEAITLNKAMGEIKCSFSGVSFGAIGDVEVNSGTTFQSPDFIFDIEFDRGVKRAEVGILIEANSYVEILTHQAVNIGGSYSPPWATLKFYPGIPTGIPFINIIPVVKITLSANIEVGSIQSENRVDVNTFIETGLIYENSAFQGYSNVEETFEKSSNLTTYAEIRGKLAIPRAGLYLNGIIGAFLELSAGGSFKVADDNSGKYLGIYGSVGIDGGFEIDVFGSGLTYREDIFEKEWELSKVYLSDPNQPPSSPSNPTPADGAINQSINSNLYWDCSDPEGDPLTYRIYFGTTPNPPLIESNHLTKNYNPGILSENTIYYWKIISEDNHGNATPGDVWDFTTASGDGMGEPCPGIPTVIYAGKTYNTVLIGEQCWLKENLDIGTAIYSNGGGQLQTDNGLIEKYCYDNDEINCATYGGLYEWKEAMQYTAQEQARGICPIGWHIPTLTEFLTLKDYLNNHGEVLVDESQNLTYNFSGIQNETGFSALLTGIRSHIDGVFMYFTNSTNFWSSTSNGNDNASDLYLLFNQGDIFLDNNDKNTGFSVRCVKD